MSNKIEIPTNENEHSFLNLNNYELQTSPSHNANISTEIGANVVKGYLSTNIANIVTCLIG